MLRITLWTSCHRHREKVVQLPEWERSEEEEARTANKNVRDRVRKVKHK
jgi:hypothetical protein